MVYYSQPYNDESKTFDRLWSHKKTLHNPLSRASYGVFVVFWEIILWDRLRHMHINMAFLGIYRFYCMYICLFNLLITHCGAHIPAPDILRYDALNYMLSC